MSGRLRLRCPSCRRTHRNADALARCVLGSSLPNPRPTMPGAEFGPGSTNGESAIAGSPLARGLFAVEAVNGSQSSRRRLRGTLPRPNAS